MGHVDIFFGNLYNLQSVYFELNSFRIGGACHAAEKGYSHAQIRALGRWKSKAIKVCLRSEALQANFKIDLPTCLKYIRQFGCYLVGLKKKHF